jgi:phage terminase large subunit-like protein
MEGIRSRHHTGSIWATLSGSPWATVDTADLARFSGDRTCLVGVDLAATADMTALVLAVPLDDGRVAVEAWFWWPERACAAAARQPGAPPYQQWADAGHLVLTEGDVADYPVVEAKIRKVAAQRTLREICYDPFGAPELVQRLMKSGLTVVPIKQDAATLNPGMQELERLVLAHRLVHDSHPVLRWNVKNARIVSNSAGAIRLDKDRRRERIDGASALVTALTRLHAPGAETPESVYTERAKRGERVLLTL